MINKCIINGYKCFATQGIDIGKLTLFTGLNNSGKSSAMQAIRMVMSERAQAGPYIDGLGGYSELSSVFSEKDDPIKISLLKEGSDLVTLSINSQGFKFMNSSELPIMQFISADRYGPRVGLPLIRDDEAFLNVGVRGEFSAHFGDLVEGVIVTDLLRHPDCPSNTLKHQLVWWMSEISPGIKLEFNVVRKYDSSQLEVNGIRPTNSGFGISYVLPVLLSLLSISSEIGDDSDPKVKQWFEHIKEYGSMLLIENPEAHLHPRGQTLIGRLAALASTFENQIILETHSDHVLDGVRLAVKDNQVLAETIKIKYFTKEFEETSKIQDVTILQDGKLDYWPKGFFDQGSINLRKLAARNKK